MTFTSLKVHPGGRLALGWIHYWNLHPLRVELERLCGAELDIHKGHPSVVNRWLAEGKVTVAPSSSICLLKYAHHEIACPLGIAANGPVTSVYLGVHSEDLGLVEMLRMRHLQLREAHRAGVARYGHDARKLAAHLWKSSDALPPVDGEAPPPLTLTAASDTSNCMARILYRLWFGARAFELNAGEAVNTHVRSLRRPLELLIGDEALTKRANYRAVIDLGEWWRDLTDLPFVFAVWQTTSRKALHPYWRQKIIEAGEIAQARMRVDPGYYLNDQKAVDAAGRPIDLAAYWRVIQYRLTPQHFMGLALYLALGRYVMPEHASDQAVLNIMRWEQAAQATAPAGL